MRRLLLYLFLLCAAVAMVFMGTRMVQAEHEARAQYEARYALASEALEALSVDLERAAFVKADDALASLLLDIARESNTARTHISSLVMEAETAATVTAAMNDVTNQADQLLCRLAAGGTMDDQAKQQLAHQQAMCRRLCAQLSLLRANHGSELTTEKLSDAVCCDGEHDQPVPIYQQPAPRGLPEAVITQEEAILLAEKYIGAGVQRAAAAPDVEGALPAYCVTVYTNDLTINAGITLHGGKLLWMSPETASFTQQISREDARLAVMDYLAMHGFGAMEEVAWQLYDGLYMAVMAPVQDQVLLYPDLVHVQVRTDTAQVVGFEASAYWTNHSERILPEPQCSAADVLVQLPAEVPHSGVSLCLLPMTGSELLCYQVQVRSGDDEYLLFYRADDGRQAVVQKLISDGQGMYPAAWAVP